MEQMSQHELTNVVKGLAEAYGFDHVGVAPAQQLPRAQKLDHWLASGKAGQMDYLHKYRDNRINPQLLLPNAQSVIVVALNYHQTPPDQVVSDGHGKIAMYAWGQDYHEVIKDKLWRMIDSMRERIPIPHDAKPCVDTAPLLEREVAMLAGIGWIGKNTLVLNQHNGSYFFLGEIVTTLMLHCDTPATDHCGSCTRCIDACPTGALTPYEMDARRCIAYHTIELRDDIPQQYHQDIGQWLFGCDICQEVCPYNQHVPTTTETALLLREHAPTIDVGDVLSWDEQDYRDTLRHTAVKRAKLGMLKRNAGIVQQNLQHIAESPTGRPRE